MSEVKDELKAAEMLIELAEDNKAKYDEIAELDKQEEKLRYSIDHNNENQKLIAASMDFGDEFVIITDGKMYHFQDGFCAEPKTVKAILP